jgi:hypothetical protein
MIDAEYLKEILVFAKKGSYAGFSSSSLRKTLCSDDSAEGDFDKFKYHMDEIWSAGLFRRHSSTSKSSGWGIIETRSGYTIFECQLVLTPAGDILLSELNSSEGFTRFLGVLKKGAAIAGEEALKFAINKLLGE